MSRFDPEALQAAAESHRQKTAMGSSATDQLAPNGSQVVMTALGGTGAIFLALSGYAVVSRKDFSFMGSFLMVGILVAFLAGPHSASITGAALPVDGGWTAH